MREITLRRKDRKRSSIQETGSVIQTLATSRISPLTKSVNTFKFQEMNEET